MLEEKRSGVLTTRYRYLLYLGVPGCDFFGGILYQRITDLLLGTVVQRHVDGHGIVHRSKDDSTEADRADDQD